MKRKILVAVVVCLAVVSIGFYYIKENKSSFVVTYSDYDIEAGITNGDVIQQGKTITNLYALEAFYKNVRSDTEDHLNIAVVNESGQTELFELEYVNNQIKLYSEIQIDSSGRKQYKIKLYDSIKKILKNDQVIYKLVNDYEERKFLSYNLK
ncbi:MAG: DUF4362 domain-containing protein [Turicibacter sp.]